MSAHQIVDALTTNADTLFSCSVCLEKMGHENVLNHPIICSPCGHRFCTLCIFKYITFVQGAVKCPLCRTQTKALIKDSMLSELSSILFVTHVIAPRTFCLPKVELTYSPSFGVTFQNMLNFPGVRVIEFDKNSSAYKNGLRIGDIVYAVGYNPVSDVTSCSSMIKREMRRNKKATLLICDRNVVLVNKVLNSFSVTENEKLRSESDTAVMKRGDVVLSCNGMLDSKMIQEMQKLGATVNGVKTKRSNTNSEPVEIVIKRLRFVHSI